VRGRQRRVPAQDHFLHRREPAQVPVRIRPFRRPRERGLRVLQLGRDRLHPGLVRPGAGREETHSGRVPGERTISERVDNPDSHTLDARAAYSRFP
jgi:hypothetical protein